MPIRDVEEFLPARDEPPRVLSNRGANGIDGTVSSAFGAAAAPAAPGRAADRRRRARPRHRRAAGRRRLGLELTIVLLNNDGGGIFHFLPVAGEADAFEEHVATPHGLDFADAAALYGARATCVRRRSTELRDALDALAAARPASTIIEVRTDRGANRRAAPRAVAAARLSRARSQPARTGSSACSLISVSASSAAGSESRTIPQPA